MNTNTSKKTIFYKKVGRRYQPVSEYDSDLSLAAPKGAHLVMTIPGGKTVRYNIDPNYAALIAAGRIAEDVISRRIMEASEIRRDSRSQNTTPLTPEQREAWDNLVRVFGDDAKQLEWPSAREIAEAGIKALQDEAEKLMNHESVKKAYEEFQLVCDLTREHE